MLVWWLLLRVRYVAPVVGRLARQYRIVQYFLFFACKIRGVSLLRKHVHLLTFCSDKSQSTLSFQCGCSRCEAYMIVVPLAFEQQKIIILSL